MIHKLFIPTHDKRYVHFSIQFIVYLVLKFQIILLFFPFIFSCSIIACSVIVKNKLNCAQGCKTTIIYRQFAKKKTTEKPTSRIPTISDGKECERQFFPPVDKMFKVPCFFLFLRSAQTMNCSNSSIVW